MALKVLLADESTSIKKAFQLALADYAVEVKSVPSGLDVLSVSLDFKPDIIFADVLLTKKSGYEVCKEIKAHPQLKTTPFILMWSHFMDFDTALATQAGFTDKIEKPFDAETLRLKVNTYVTKTKDHPLHGMIQFPDMPDFIESETFVRQKNNYYNEKYSSLALEVDDGAAKESSQKSEITSPTDPIVAAAPQTVATSTGATEEFKSVQLAPNLQNSDAFEIEIETENFGEFEEVVLVKSDKVENLQSRIHEQVQSYLENSPVAAKKNADTNTQTNARNTFSTKASNFDEQMLREEIRLMTEKICWQIIPDITEKIVREEIAKLLLNIDKSI